MSVVDDTMLEVSDVDGSRATPQASNEWVAHTIHSGFSSGSVEGSAKAYRLTAIR